MAWTTKKPNLPGWYWYRGGEDTLPLAVEVMNWSPLPGHPRELHLFYPPRSPEETGVCPLEMADDGEWDGPIGPGLGVFPSKPRPEPTALQPSPDVAPVEVLEAPPVSHVEQRPPSPELMKEILAWFVTLGADHLPHDFHQAQLVELANMLAAAFGMKMTFESVNDVIGFMMGRLRDETNGSNGGFE